MSIPPRARIAYLPDTETIYPYSHTTSHIPHPTFHPPTLPLSTLLHTLRLAPKPSRIPTLVHTIPPPTDQTTRAYGENGVPTKFSSFVRVAHCSFYTIRSFRQINRMESRTQYFYSLKFDLMKWNCNIQKIGKCDAGASYKATKAPDGTRKRDKARVQIRQKSLGTNTCLALRKAP